MPVAAAIRAAGPGDLPVLAEAVGYAAGWRGGTGRPVAEVLGQPDLARYVAGWPRPGDLGVVAEDAGRPVGAAWLRQFGPADPGYGYVAPDVPELSIGLAPGYRGRGIGGALLAALLDAARTAGLGRVSLSVEIDNPAARLYWRTGFRVLGVVGGAWTMGADLAPAAPDGALLRAVRDGLAAAADPDRAPAMQAYTKSELPFRGVPKPARAALLRPLFAAHPVPDPAGWQATALALWRDAGYREERYAALDLIGWRGYARWRTVALLPLYDEFVVTGAWWDLVDEVAIRRIGPLVRSDPATLAPLVRAWARDGDRWRRRTAVVCQLTARAGTDPDLLADAIDANLDDRDFFVRKAIGWALRDYAKTDPDWVRAFVADRAVRLSPLSRREALRHLDSRPQ